MTSTPTPTRTPDERALAVVHEMLGIDAFARWLGVEILEAGLGHSVIRMTVRPEMVNGFNTSHGGIVFSFADSALAFCSNACGYVTVAVDCSVSYTRPVLPGHVLVARATEQSSTNTLAFCAVTVTNESEGGVTCGHFRGTVYRTRKRHAAYGWPDDSDARILSPTAAPEPA